MNGMCGDEGKAGLEEPRMTRMSADATSRIELRYRYVEVVFNIQTICVDLRHPRFHVFLERCPARKLSVACGC
jgi:hypothetical protein